MMLRLFSAIIIFMLAGCSLGAYDVYVRVQPVPASNVHDPTPTQETLPTFQPLPSPTATLEPTPESPRIYVNNSRQNINLRRGAGTGFSIAGVLPPGGRVEVRDNREENEGWWGVCVILNDFACEGSYWVASWLIEPWTG